MKKFLSTIAIIFALTSSSLVNAANYKIDNEGSHASINFKISHLGYSFTVGRFNSFEGDFSYDPNDISASKINVKVFTSSVDTNHAERDKHIRSIDFINARKFTTAKFVSTKVVATKNQNFKIFGNLSLHGKTKPIMIDAKVIGAGKDPWGGERAGFEGKTRLELADFDIAVEGKSSYVDLELFVEGIKEKS